MRVLICWKQDLEGEKELQKRENLLHVGIELHKESHTAVMVNYLEKKTSLVNLKSWQKR